MQHTSASTSVTDLEHLSLQPSTSTGSSVAETVSLRLIPRRKKKVVKWAGDVVDNELMNKKSSKKCCIFHKQRPFGEWSEDEGEQPCDKEQPCKDC